MVLINIQFQLGTQGIRKGFSVRFAHIRFAATREFLISECTRCLRCGAHDRGGCARVKECLPWKTFTKQTHEYRPRWNSVCQPGWRCATIAAAMEFAFPNGKTA